MGRATFLAFFVKPGPDSKASHAHESPWVMTAPLATLAVLAVTAGLIGSPLAGYAFGNFMGEHEAAEPSYLLMAIAIGVAVAGISLAWGSYIKRFFEPDGYFKSWFVTGPLSHKFWIDEVYHHGVVRPVNAIAEGARTADSAVIDAIVRAFGWVGLKISALLAVFDRKGVDGAFDAFGDGVSETGNTVRKIQNGNVQTYLLFMVAAIVVLVAVFAR